MSKDQFGFKFKRRFRDVLNERDPELLKLHYAYREHVYNKNNIPPKYKELTLIALDAVTKWPGIISHMKTALDLGISEAEIMETLELASLVGGFQSTVFGVEMFDRLIQANNAGKLNEVIYDL